MPAEGRSLRDRLAEASYLAEWSAFGAAPVTFAKAHRIARKEHRLKADALLAALPTVGLVLTSSEDTTQTRQVQGGGE